MPRRRIMEKGDNASREAVKFLTSSRQLSELSCPSVKLRVLEKTAQDFVITDFSWILKVQEVYEPNVSSVIEPQFHLLSRDNVRLSPPRRYSLLLGTDQVPGFCLREKLATKLRSLKKIDQVLLIGTDRRRRSIVRSSEHHISIHGLSS